MSFFNDLSGPHDYGRVPSRQGAVNYARDLNIANNLKVIRETLQAEHHGPLLTGTIFVRVLGPLSLLCGIILASIAFYQALYGTSAYGTQSKLVDTTVATGTNTLAFDSAGGIQDQTQYQFSASSSPAMQQWALRAGQWGRAFPISLTLPDPTTMKPSSLVYVRNLSAKWKDGDNNTVGPSSYPVNVIPLSAGGTPLTTIPISSFQSNVFIAASNSSGAVEWYPALLMSGAV